MIDRPTSVRPTRRPVRPARASGFGSLWRWFLPGAIALMVLAILQGVVDPDAGPVWLFGGGVAIAVVGVGSLLRHLIDQGRAQAKSLERRLEGRGDREP